MFGQPPMVHKGGKASIAVGIVAWLSAAVLVFTLWVLGRAITCPVPGKFVMQLKVLGIFWAVGPPVWFWFEYYALWNRDPSTFETLKHGQALSAAIWLATLASIAAYLKVF